MLVFVKSSNNAIRFQYFFFAFVSHRFATQSASSGHTDLICLKQASSSASTTKLGPSYSDRSIPSSTGTWSMNIRVLEHPLSYKISFFLSFSISSSLSFTCIFFLIVLLSLCHHFFYPYFSFFFFLHVSFLLLFFFFFFFFFFFSYRRVYPSVCPSMVTLELRYRNISSHFWAI